MVRPINEVIKACDICLSWAITRKSHADCPYFSEENCEDVLKADVLEYLNQLKDIQQPTLPGIK